MLYAEVDKEQQKSERRKPGNCQNETTVTCPYDPHHILYCYWISDRYYIFTRFRHGLGIIESNKPISNRFICEFLGTYNIVQTVYLNVK